MLLACSLLASGAAAAVTELKVEVYDGPKECEDADKLKKGEHVSMHYTVRASPDIAAPGESESTLTAIDICRCRSPPLTFSIATGHHRQGQRGGHAGQAVRLVAWPRQDVRLPAGRRPRDPGLG